MQTLSVDEEMTIFTAAAQKEQLLGFLASGDALEINLSKVAEIDSAGLQLLIMAKREALKANKSLDLVMHSKAVLEAFELTNLYTFFGDQVILAQQAGSQA